jgi:hypothetical protein
MKLPLLLIFLLMSAQYVYAVSAQPPVITSSTVSTQSNLEPFTGSVFSTSSPLPTSQLSQDRGTNTVRYTQSSIQFFRGDGVGNITIGLPTLTVGLSPIPLSAVATKNSTEIVYSLIGGLDTVSVGVSNATDPYDRLITYSGVLSAPGSLQVPLSNPQKLVPSACDSKSHIYNQTVVPPCTQQCYGSMCFSWGDVQSFTYNNQTDILTMNVPATFSIDPLAIDGTGATQCQLNLATSTCVVTLSTTNTNDVIMVEAYEAISSCSSVVNQPTIADTSLLSWTGRGYTVSSNTHVSVKEFWAISTGLLSTDAITVTSTGGTGTGACVMLNVIAFGVSGANTATPFDTNAGLPYVSTGSGTSSTTTITTSNANDFLFTDIVTGCSNGGLAVPGGYSTIANLDTSCALAQSDALYKIVSSTQIGVAVTYTWSTSHGFGQMTDAIQQATVPTVTMPISVIVAPAGSASGTFGISGCNTAATNATFVATTAGYTHTYLSVTASCTITVTVPAGSSTIRYRFAQSTPVGAQTWLFTTCATGTCSRAQNTSYYQLANTYTATPFSPGAWDGVYTVNLVGTYVGFANHIRSTASTSNGGGVVTFSLVFLDYNSNVSLPYSIGTTWIYSVAHSFTETTGGNTNNVNYFKSSSSGGTTVNEDSYIVIGGILMGFIVVPMILLSVLKPSSRRRVIKKETRR